MMNLLKYTLLIFLLSFAACSSDDDGTPSVPNGQPHPDDALELTVSAADFVTDGAPDTRATDDGNRTTFEDGDRVGIIILDADNNPIYDNIPYKYDSSNKKWVFDDVDGKGGCYYDTKAKTYIVYYPYSRAADGVTSVDELKTKFAPKFNQSDINDYRSSDLMVWNSSILTPPVTTLNAELEHAFASVYLTPTAYTLDDGNDTKGNVKVSDVSLTIGNNVYVPYQATDGSLRCIVPASINPSGIRCFYTFSGTTYGNTINIKDAVAPNTRYTSAPEIISKTYTLDDAKVGDFYCKRSDNNEGYLIPGDVALTDGQKKACIGIVMKVGKDNSDDWRDDCEYKLKNSNTEMTTIYGYVLALYDANDGNTCQWGSYGTSVGTNTDQTTGFYGYKNTQTIIDYDKNNGKNLQNNFPATYHATTGYESIYSAPNNSSGWFLPSAGQCQYWLNNKESLLLKVKNVTGNNSYNWLSWYWSSSEYSYDLTHNAWSVDFLNGYVYGGVKYTNRGVRSCLAF